MSSDSEDSASPPKKSKTTEDNNDSSSESDIENYLQKPKDLNLNSSFFKSNISSSSKNPSATSKNSNLSDSDSEKEKIFQSSTSIASCSKDSNHSISDPFAEITKQALELQEAKKQIEAYLEKRQIEQNEIKIDDLLAAGEKSFDLKRDLAEVGFHASDFESDNESDIEDWEEVKDSEERNIIPKDGVQITVEMPNAIKKKKKSIDLMAALKRRMNRIRKENQVAIHKVHLLCWLAHGNYVNELLNQESIMCEALSLMPSKESYPPKRTNLKYLEQITLWYHKTIHYQPTDESNDERTDRNKMDLNTLIKKQIVNKVATSVECLIYIYVALLRALGMQCRLVLSLQVEPLRPPNSELHSLKNENKRINNQKERVVKQKSKKSETIVKEVANVGRRSLRNAEKNSENKLKAAKTSKVDSSRKPNFKKLKSNENLSTIEKVDKKIASKSKIQRTRKLETLSKSIDKSIEDLEALERCKTKKSQSSDEQKSTQTSNKTSNIKTRSASKKVKKIPQIDGSIDTSSSETEIVDKHSKQSNKCTKGRKINIQTLKTPPDKHDIIKLDKNDRKEAKKRSKSSDSDSDSKPLKSPPKKSKHSPGTKVKKRVLPRSELEKQAKAKDSEEMIRKKGVDIWVEVFLEEEEKWITANIPTGKVHCIKDIYSQASHPACYILSWDNKSRIKDISQRYCPNWNTVTRKLRVDPKWWADSLRGFIGEQSERDKDEDDDLARQQLDQPLPKTISEYKDHPLYVLRRHLLKFQAIYPPDALSLGFVRNEPVYSRSCVYLLHSRDIWLKHAKVVKPGEQPYKIVKARPKYDKLSNSMITDQLLEIFGVWQVQDYDPPTAENGIVPRNAYGNVELFKSCMLPKKCVHLQLPGLNKVARKLHIDCAPAVVGFDFHGGWNHAVYDGFIVCEEFREQLVKAWEQEQEDCVKREQEKYEKRVFGNWRKLIKAALIRARLQARYDFDDQKNDLEEAENTEKPKETRKKRPKFTKRN